jgi:hypothetical protein
VKRTLSVLFAAMVALLSLVGTATAGPATPAKPPVTIPVPAQHDVSPLALSCSSGNLCVWPVSDGSRNRCSWSNADNDWWNSPVVCSWSSSSAVQAVYNHGASTSYTGVCLYPAANYGGDTAYYVTRGQQVQGWPGVIIRSHKWVTNGWCF